MFIIDTPAKKIELVILSDIHIGAAEHAGKHFVRTLDYIKKNKCYWGFLGDGMENVTPEKSGDMQDDQVMTPMEQFKALAGHLGKLDKTKCAFIIEGNHEFRSVKQARINLTDMLASHLGRLDRFFNIGGMFRAKVGSNIYNLTLYHGASNARTNRFADHDRRYTIHPNSDLIAMGHTHFLGFEERVKLDLDEKGKEIGVPYYFLRTGTYLKYADYARRFGFPPGRIGSPIVELSGEKNRKAIKIDVQTLAAI